MKQIIRAAAVFSVVGAAFPSMAQDFPSAMRLGMQPEKSQIQQILYADSQDLLVLDVSGSMSFYDIRAAFWGAAAYYLSERSKVNYDMGICTLNTSIYFAKTARIGKTSIICSEQDAKAFIKDALAVNFEEIRKELNPDATNVVKGAEAAVAVFSDEAYLLGYEPIQRRVVFVGDESGGNLGKLRLAGDVLKGEFDAQVYAISINDEVTRANFDSVLISNPVHFPTALATNFWQVGVMLGDYFQFTAG